MIGVGALVLTPDGWTPIEDLLVGDTVVSFSEKSGESEVSSITAIRTALRGVGTVECGEQALRITADHPVYDPLRGVYAPASDWFSGKRTSICHYHNGLQTQQITDVDPSDEMIEVYDVTVASDCHNYVADGVLVHNASGRF